MASRVLPQALPHLQRALAMRRRLRGDESAGCGSGAGSPRSGKGADAAGRAVRALEETVQRLQTELA